MTAEVAKPVFAVTFPPSCFKYSQRGVIFLFPLALIWSGYNVAQLDFPPLPWQQLLGSQQPPSVQLWVSFGRKPMRAAQFVTRHPINVSGVRWRVGRSVIVPMGRSGKGAVGMSCRAGI